MEIIHAIQRRGPVTARVVALPWPRRWAVYHALIFGTIALGTFTQEEFIYFAF